MDLQQLYDQRLQKIDQLKEFIILYSVKCEKYKDIEIISQESVNIKKLLNECANSVRKFQNYNRARITEIIKKSQKQQTIIFNILDKLENEKPNKSIVSFVRQSAQKSILQGKENCLQTPVQKLRLLKLGDTPLMSLDDYMKSPFTLKKTKPISLQFIDFHYAITPIEFSKVPSYMKGRDTVHEIQDFLDRIIIKCFTMKYLLLPKRREAVPSGDMDKWNLYKSQEEYFAGHKFITQGDICRLTDKQIDKKMNNRISILRHLKILREERKNAAICYIWVK